MTNAARLQRRFLDSCQAASNYPCNLLFPRLYKHQVADYFDLLEDHSEGLFGIKTAIAFLEFDHAGEPFREACVYTHSELNSQLRLQSNRQDPLCRLIFFNAPSARDELRTDREMFTRILTYHQVMPSFLDFVLAFGKQERAKDFYYCGFRSEMSMDATGPLLRLPNLHRSGRELRCCYSLRSVENYDSKRKWPWSIRQSVVYHCYDVESENATWVVIKANKLLKNRINALRNDEIRGEEEAANLDDSQLSTAFMIHQLFASWSAERWRWYINFLEERLQELSKTALTESVDYASVLRDISAPRLPPTGDVRPQDDEDEAGTSFDQLQDVHHIDEKASEALLVVEANLDVLQSLEDFYAAVSEEFQKDERPEDVRQAEVLDFRKTLIPIRNELSMHRKRLTALLRLVESRKSLLRSLLQQRDISTTFALARQAQDSNEHVESVTVDMQSIAQSTKVETVSMRIITFVTLVYLPGTFISTLMSTPVIELVPPDQDYSHNRLHINLRALRLFVEISVPLLLFTVAVWWFFKKTSGRKGTTRDCEARRESAEGRH